jgi:hypothetical protein
VPIREICVTPFSPSPLEFTLQRVPFLNLNLRRVAQVGRGGTPLGVCGR